MQRRLQRYLRPLFIFTLIYRALSAAIFGVQVLDGDGLEYTRESEEDKALMRKLAADSIVLLKNEGSILPLEPSKLKKIAIVGGNAKAFVLSGGGSAALKPSYFTSPYDGIVAALGKDVEVTYSEGARGMCFAFLSLVSVIVWP